MSGSVVWFKRDLRVRDHAALTRAAAAGPILPLYIFEPQLYAQPDFDSSHLQFVLESLSELGAALAERGTPLLFAVGEPAQVLTRIRAVTTLDALHSHQETGNDVSYQRDRAVLEWCRSEGISWHEPRQHGVLRRQERRDGWAARWKTLMHQPQAQTPTCCVPWGSEPLAQLLGSGVLLSKAPTLAELGLPESTKRAAQRGGRRRGLEILKSFLRERGRNYQREMSSPVEATLGCSRLSPHLAYGTISMREVVQRTERELQRARRAAARGEPVARQWRDSLNSFIKRLHWHCHFIQKLEDQPSLEFENMARCYDGLREHEFDQEKFDAFCSGHTGYPLVDACMRCLHQVGWINFRMRAMLASFAAYDLWLHWRPTALYLARQFVDYEPGIHFSQMQMQSGTTGMNSLRMYSPTKQLKDHDPSGRFVRRWLPELAQVPDAYLAEPHLMPTSMQSAIGYVPGETYPYPIVDHTRAVGEARKRLEVVRRTEEARQEAKQVYQRHGSRRGPVNRAGLIGDAGPTRGSVRRGV